jgi:hypothetical protein
MNSRTKSDEGHNCKCILALSEKFSFSAQFHDWKIGATALIITVEGKTPLPGISN